MRTWIAAMLAAIVLAMPLAVADEANASAQANGDAQTVSAWNLRFRQFGEGVGDFVFKVRVFFTFDENAKVELLKERNAELQARQDAWLETKAELLARSENLTSEQKQEIVGVIQAEHEAIIKEHLETTEGIREIQLSAKARGDAGVEEKAEAAAEAAEESRLSVGLKLVGNGMDGMLKLKVRIGGDGEVRAMTAEEAQAMVEEEFGFESTTVTTVTENGRTVHVVTGSESEAKGNVVMTKEITVKVDAETGTVTSVDFNATFRARAEANASGNATANASGCKGFLCLGIGVTSSAEAGGSAQASGGAEAESESEAGAQASGGAHAESSASGSASAGGHASSGASIGSQGGSASGGKVAVRIG